MVCILCDSKTKIANSRSNSRLRQTWRRHTCNRCNSIFTTREVIDMSMSYRVEQLDGSLHVFSRDTLLLSVYRALEHRTNAVEDAGDLVNTIVGYLIAGNRLIIPIELLVETTTQTLKRFSRSSALIYSALRSQK